MSASIRDDLKRGERFLSITTVGGCVAVILVDTIGSLISRTTGFPYGYFAIVSCAIYIAIGIIDGYARSARSAVISAFAVSLVDATIGWWVSWQLGPGRLTATSTARIYIVILTGMLVVSFDTLLAFGAGAISHAVRSRHLAHPRT